MLVKDILAIASSILLSVGGSGVIICSVSRFLAERIVKRIDSKYQLMLDQELEKYRSLLDQRIYVSQTQFDNEFQIYKQLSKAYFTVAVKVSSFAFDYEKKNTISIKAGDISREEINRLIDATCTAQNLLFENAAFIPEDIFNAYYELYVNTNAFFWKIIDKIDEYPQMNNELGETNIECDITLAKVIESELGEINKKVREHLESLTIIPK
jgi:hypothetical protein